ncbi:c-type cytochrome [Piscinibacter defluvii]|uniref:c-type cytochrome n=1 Tax=Piscinibacter defluvii TaxID=1796922 RepID=UPI000FDE0383|nr:c-type cytochrome [Piscinibacter defluvii]
MHRYRTALACGGLAAAFAAAAAPLPDTLAQRVAPCTACHGKEGRAAPDGYHPRIAGKPAGYLYNQLLNFRDGRRRYAPMVYLVDPLSDGYLREIAEHFAALDLPYPAPAPTREDAATLQHGERLVQQGDPARELPACTGCHGRQLTGVAPAVPGLLGLPRDYLGAQLGAWVSGQRRAQAPDCMAAIARKLTPQDVAALAAWLASRPVPQPARPAARFEADPPLECGGVPRSP